MCSTHSPQPLPRQNTEPLLTFTSYRRLASFTAAAPGDQRALENELTQAISQASSFFYLKTEASVLHVTNLTRSAGATTGFTLPTLFLPSLQDSRGN